ncbi:hypothetical protein PG991_000909 [Apiospora marii]|uniref:Uncharacterized protein n=1 Tax=Apiospora marii TaxID=335849 RepID=A0ABR1SVL9_9PEZI
MLEFPAHPHLLQEILYDRSIHIDVSACPAGTCLGKLVATGSPAQPMRLTAEKPKKPIPLDDRLDPRSNIKVTDTYNQQPGEIEYQIVGAFEAYDWSLELEDILAEFREQHPYDILPTVILKVRLLNYFYRVQNTDPGDNGTGNADYPSLAQFLVYFPSYLRRAADLELVVPIDPIEFARAAVESDGRLEPLPARLDRNIHPGPRQGNIDPSCPVLKRYLGPTTAGSEGADKNHS